MRAKRLRRKISFMLVKAKINKNMLANLKKQAINKVVAGLAQMVEQRIRNAWVGGSSPLTGTIKKSIPTDAFFNGAIDIAASQGRDSNRREQKCL